MGFGGIPPPPYGTVPTFSRFFLKTFLIQDFNKNNLGLGCKFKIDQFQIPPDDLKHVNSSGLFLLSCHRFCESVHTSLQVSGSVRKCEQASASVCKCPQGSASVSKCPKVRANVGKCQQVSGSVGKCGQVYEIVCKCLQISAYVCKCPHVSASVWKCPQV